MILALLVQTPTKGTRSDMPWDKIHGEREDLLQHWQKLGEFRKRHPAVAQGKHITRNQEGYYAFETPIPRRQSTDCLHR